MYSNQEAALLRQRFWISFGKYMNPIPSSTGEKVNWINYRTNIKHLNFKMDTTGDGAVIAIEMTHREPAEQLLYFNHFKTFKPALEEILEEKWAWDAEHKNEHGQTVARIYAELEGVNVLDENAWPKIISFFKQRIIALDRFWNDYREIFEMLN